MTRKQFIRNILMTGCTIATYPLLSYQKSLKQINDTYIPCILTQFQYEIYKSIHTCINYIHNVYQIPFDEYKNPFVVFYYIPKEVKFEDIKTALEISKYISKIYKYKFCLMFRELPISNGKYSSVKRCRLMILDIDKKDWYYTPTFILNSKCDKVISSNLLTDHIVIEKPNLFKPKMTSVI